MTKIIITFFVIGCIALTSPKKEDISVPIPIYKSPVVAKTAHRTKIKHKSNNYVPPTGKPLEIAIHVSKETGYTVEKISKIMDAESTHDGILYDLHAYHKNKNGTFDSGSFQVNSIHIPEAKKMGLDIVNNPDDNATFAIHLMKKNGLSDWSASKHKWGT